MPPVHTINIGLHVTAGIVALAIGAVILASDKGTSRHRRLGRAFCYAGLALCLFATIGLAVFRFMPLFTVLLLLALYQFLSGWRISFTKQHGPAPLDGAFTALTIGVTLLLTPALRRDSAPAVIATLAALALVLLYDAARLLFPRRWYHTLWEYEHTYKMVSALYGMVAAFVGSVLTIGQPWLQHVATVVGQLSVLYFFWRIGQRHRAATALSLPRSASPPAAPPAPQSPPGPWAAPPPA